MGLVGADTGPEPAGSGPAPRGRAGRRPILAILLLALALRAGYVLASPPEIVFDNVDAKGYLILATNLLQRGAFSLDTVPPFVPDGVRTPLYPAFLAGLLALGGDPARVIPLAQCLLDTATTALVFAMAARVAGRRRGWLAALFYGANPISLMFVGQALTEVLLAFLVALTFALFALGVTRQGRRRTAFLALAGLSSGLCILCKPNALLMPVLLAAGVVAAGAPAVRAGALRDPDGALPGQMPVGPAGSAAGSPRDAGPRLCLLTSPRAWREALLVLAVAGLVLVPWVLRNQAVFGRPFLSLAFDDNLAHVSAVATLLQSQGVRTAPWSPIWEETYMQQVVAVAGARYHWAAAGGHNPQAEPTGGGLEAAAPRSQAVPPVLIPAAPAAAAEAARRQEEVAAVAHDIILAHPAAFVASHLLGVLRSLAPALHRYWYTDLTGQPFPEAASPRAVLRAVGGIGTPVARLARLQALPALALGLLLASYGLTAAACVLLAGGLVFLWHRQPGLFVSVGLTLAYYVVLPGPLAYVRFWVPAAPLMAAGMALAFAGWARGLEANTVEAA